MQVFHIKIIRWPNTKKEMLLLRFNLERCICRSEEKWIFYSVDSKEPIKSTRSMVSNQR